jgi:hypothetical protein
MKTCSFWNLSKNNRFYQFPFSAANKSKIELESDLSKIDFEDFNILPNFVLSLEFDGF